eukprot:GEMP01071079.1.p1 GENE.GEMP01071079.1~~GEMP01071079.1.p1  ORF type:complete len:167 (+),score=27.68 GEMP01071079.1:137-637(+)
MVAVVIAIVAVFFVVGVLIYTLGYCFFALGDNADEKEEEVVVDGEGTVMDTEVENDFWRWLKLEAVERELRRSRTVDKLERTNSQQGGRKPVSFLMQNRSLGKISPSATALDCKNTRSFDSDLVICFGFHFYPSSSLVCTNNILAAKNASDEIEGSSRIFLLSRKK